MSIRTSQGNVACTRPRQTLSNWDTFNWPQTLSIIDDASEYSFCKKSCIFSCARFCTFVVAVESCSCTS